MTALLNEMCLVVVGSMAFHLHSDGWWHWTKIRLRRHRRLWRSIHDTVCTSFITRMPKARLMTRTLVYINMMVVSLKISTRVDCGNHRGANYTFKLECFFHLKTGLINGRFIWFLSLKKSSFLSSFCCVSLSFVNQLC